MPLSRSSEQLTAAKETCLEVRRREDSRHARLEEAMKKIGAVREAASALLSLVAEARTDIEATVELGRRPDRPQIKAEEVRDTVFYHCNGLDTPIVTSARQEATDLVVITRDTQEDLRAFGDEANTRFRAIAAVLNADTLTALYEQGVGVVDDLSSSRQQAGETAEAIENLIQGDEL
jgi:hypothetical protein